MARNLLIALILISLLASACGTPAAPTRDAVAPQATAPSSAPGAVAPRVEATAQAPAPGSEPAPAAPAPSAPPVEFPANPADLSAFPPGAPFTIRFDQPVDPGSARPALLTYPWVDGEVHWNQDYTALRFTPTTGFGSDRQLTLLLNPDLRTTSGQPAGPETEWVITTLSAPRLSSRSPATAQLSSRRPQITLTFDRPMDAASVAAALSIQPPADFSLSWPSPDTADIQLTSPLDPGQRYTFALSSLAADTRGVSLDAPLTWDYYLPAWKADLSGPTFGRAYLPIRLKFSYPVSAASFEQALLVSPSLNLNFDWKNPTELILETHESLPAGQTYTLRFTSPLSDENGDPLPSLEPLTLHTPPPLLNLRPAPGAENISPDVRITLLFDRPMDLGKTQAALSISPEVSGSFEWDENLLTFTPEGLLSDFTTYTLTLNPEAAGLGGEPVLSEPFSWSFKTAAISMTEGHLASFGEYGPNAQVLDAAGRRAIQFVASRRTTQVDFSIYALTLEQFLDRYSSGFRGVAGNERKPISLEGAALAAEWSFETIGKGMGWDNNIFETLIPADLPTGMYVMDMKVGGTSQGQLIVVLTTSALVLKQSPGELTVWTTSIPGGSRSNLPVSIYARDGSLITTGASDASGIFRTPLLEQPEPLIVIAGSGSDLTVSGFTREWIGRGGYWWGWWTAPLPQPVDYRAFLHTERPLYQPGQTVYFKAVVRLDDDASYSMPPAGTPVTVRIRDARDNIVQTFSLSTSDLGSVHGEFVLGDGAMSGDYHLEAEVAGERFRQIFKVQDYRKPDFEVSLSPDRTSYVNGDQVQVTVKAAYYFGEPVANARITLKRYYLEQSYSYGWDEPAAPAEYIWYTSIYEDLTGRTDENGLFTFTLPAGMQDNYSPYDDYSTERTTTWGLEATLDDGSRQTVSGFTTYQVHSANHKLSLDTGSYLQRPGEPFRVGASVTDLDGKPVPDAPLTLSLLRWNPSSWSYSSQVQFVELRTGPEGTLSHDFTIAASGYYLMRLSGEDDRGNPLTTASWVYAFSRGSSFFYGQTGLRISPDKASYLPGETAQLVIESAQAGPALLTFERGSVHREQIITLSPPLTLVPVLIEESDAPNIFAAVHIWEPQDPILDEYVYSTKADSRLLSASIDLKVQVTGRSLNVEILTDRPSYTPREQASITVRVTNEAGLPVQTEVSLALVDEALYALSQDLTRPIFDVFYASRSNKVKTYNTMALTRELFLGGMGGGGGDSGLGAPRADFRDTAAWFPALQTDENGLVTVSLVLPDNLTSWRITARAVSAATQVGEAAANILTHQDVIVRPFVPYALTAGDALTLTGAVHSYASEPRRLEVSLTAASHTGEDLLQIEAVTHTIVLKPGEVRFLAWDARALGEGQVTLTLRAAASDGLPGDAVSLPIPIRQISVTELSTQAGSFVDVFNTTFSYPLGALPTSYVEVQVSRSVAGALLDGLEYLIGYPYGCVEQTMSRLLPTAVVARAYSTLGVSDPTLAADLPPMINAGLQRLYGYQHTDGGWGWWYDDRTDAYQTAWVVYGLSVTAQAGFEVDPQVIERGAKWLSANLSKMDPRLQAFALYSLASAGYAETEAALALADQAYRLDTFSQSALALALHLDGRPAAARRIADHLAASARTADSGAVSWPQATSDGDYHLRTMASTTRTTALALNALVLIAPEHELIPGAASWLMGQRRQYGWGSTNETAFTILSLSDYLLSTITAEPETAVTISLNGEALTTLQLSGHPAGESASARLRIPLADLEPGVSLLSLTQSGAGRLYVTTRTHFDLPYPDLPSAGTVSLTREYLDRTWKPMTAILPGQLVRVRLTLETDSPFFFAILEDNLPAGLEPLNENLNTTSRVTDLYSGSDLFYYNQLGYNNKEVHGDRVSFFITEVKSGRTIIEYFARAVTPGVFTALPAGVSAMYDESVWGRSASDLLTVVED
jgi:alpha-2-macroglobulin